MKRILVIDDDKKTVAALSIRLSAAGYEVLSAHHGWEGLQVALRYRPDLILLDVWMPNEVGVLTAQRLKHFGLVHTPVIFLTSSPREEVWPLAREVDPAGFFEKPFDAKDLLASIELILASGVASIPAAGKGYGLSRMPLPSGQAIPTSGLAPNYPSAPPAAELRAPGRTPPKRGRTQGRASM
jgi:DNA-binding response OmpR family regulator